jgi:hypothetical protein
MKSTVFWDVTPYNAVKLTDVSEENSASVPGVEECCASQKTALFKSKREAGWERFRIVWNGGDVEC